MVYCGKPSKACRSCRARNIKCDKKRESCGQCLRAQLTCPGYYDPSKLIFRDETKSVMKKVLSQKQVTSVPALMFQPTTQERAKAMFIEQQVFRNTGKLQYMKEFYPPKPAEDRHLLAAVRAVGLAYFSNEVGNSYSILQDARKMYSSALMFTKAAIHNPQILSRDSTVLTILLLDLFENLTRHQNPDKPENPDAAETKHLEGALALVKLRGANQFGDRLSIMMFMHLGSNILSSCLMRGADVPSDFISLLSQVEKFVDVQDPGWQLFNLMIRVAKYRNAMRLQNLTDKEADLIPRTLRTEVNVLSEIKGPIMSYPGSEEDHLQTSVWFAKDILLLQTLLESPPTKAFQAIQSPRIKGALPTYTSDGSTRTLSSSLY